jgi:small subunit ribosomal protein S13
MPRIMGVDIPREKNSWIALTYLYGVGRTLSREVLKKASVDPKKKAKDLTDQEVSLITNILQEQHKVEGDLRREVQQNIKRLMDIRAYRGIRHIRGLPVHGQRTHTNSRTRKGPRRTMSGLNKKPPTAK